MHLCQCMAIMFTSLPLLYHDCSVNRAHSLQIIAGVFFVSCSGLTSRQKKCVLADGHARVLEELFKIVCILRLWAGKSGVRVPAGAKSFFSPNVQTSCGAHPAIYSVGIEVLPGNKVTWA